MVGNRAVRGSLKTSSNRLRIGGNSIWGEYFKGRIEAGEVQVTSQWQRVDFSTAFTDPIVIANAMSTNGGAPAVIRIRQVEPTGFDIRAQRWHDAEGEPPSVDVGFLVLERGTYTLVDGTLIEAGSVEVARSGTPSTSQTMPFSRRFNAVPVVMTAVTSFNETKPVASRLLTTSKGSVQFRLDSEVYASPITSTETLSYIAWESSAGTLQGIAFEVHRTPGIGRKQLHTLAFLGAFDTPPIVLAEVQEGASGSRLTVRWDVEDTNGVGVTLDTGPGAEEEHDAPTDVLGYIALQ